MSELRPSVPAPENGPHLDRMVGRSPIWTGRLMALVGAVLLFLIPSDPATPQTPATGTEEAETFLLPDTVLIQSTKILRSLRDLAGAGTVLGASSIRVADTRSMREVIGQLPGVHSYDLSGGEGLGVIESRGFTSFGQTSYMQVLVDGLPVSDLEADRVNWALLSPSQLERVEFLRGPLAFLYGNSSMTGVVNLITRKPLSGIDLWGETSAGSFDYQSVSLGATYAGNRTHGAISSVHRRQDGYRDHSASSSTEAYGRLSHRLTGDWNLQTRLLAYTGRQDIPGPLTEDLRRSAPKRSITSTDEHDERVLQPSLEIAGRLGTHAEMTGLLQLDVRRDERTETVIPAGTLDRDTRSESALGEIRLRLRDLHRRVQRTLLGISVTSGNLRSRYYDPMLERSTGPVGSGDVHRTSTALFGWVETNLYKKLALLGGLRWDWASSKLDGDSEAEDQGGDRELSAVSPAVGLNYEAAGWGNLYLTVAGSYKAPTLEQLYDQRPYLIDVDGPGETPPFDVTLSSRRLDPQRGVHVDLGTRGRIANAARLEAAVYYVRSTDEIGFDLGSFRYDNIDKSVHFGFEGAADFRPIKRLDTGVSYTWTRARFEGGPDDGKQINNVPEHQIRFRARISPRRNSTVSAFLVHVRDQFIDEGNLYPLPSYTTVDLHIGQRIRGLALFARIGNLFNERYEPAGFLTIDERGQDLPLYFPAPGRSIQVGVRSAD